MNRVIRALAWIGIVAVVASLVGAIVLARRSPLSRIHSFSVVGVVLRQNTDPHKQLPIANVEVTGTSGRYFAAAKTDTSGLFKLIFEGTGERSETVAIEYRHKDFEPLTLKDLPPDHLIVARLTSNVKELGVRTNRPPIPIKYVRLRYTVKLMNTNNTGSVAQPFEVVNKANVPCNNRPPCSPDRLWKAARRTFTLDAGERNQFQNGRVTCIAGPCPFSQVESSNLDRPTRVINVTVINWSDPVTYLLEAEVSRTMMIDMVRQAYPVIFGPAMNFTLPPTAEGPSVEAELDGAPIVFPLGPSLRLSWAQCDVEVAPDHTRLFQCELKPGYQFQQQ